jgi:hypothetical protein
MRYLLLGLRNFVKDPSGQTILGVAAVVIAAGTIFYRVVEDLRWIDSLYFSVITLTTVGYGDIAPATTAGKLFTMVYVIVGIGVFVALVTEIAQHLIAARQEKRR